MAVAGDLVATLGTLVLGARRGRGPCLETWDDDAVSPRMSRNT